MVLFRNQHFAFGVATALTLFSGFSNAATITEALQSYPDLSGLVAVLQLHKDFADLLNNKEAKTFLAPTNSALATMSQLSFTEQQALFQYHVLNGSHQATSFAAPGGATMQTYLQQDQYANLGGQPNVVFTSKYGNSGLDTETQLSHVFSGLGTSSAIQPLNIAFDGGMIQGVDSLFSLPQTCTETAKKVGLNGLLAALDRSKLMDYLDKTQRITCFAPSDMAFNRSGSPQLSLSPDVLAQALKYHTLQGAYIGYTDTWTDGQELTTLAGESVVVKKVAGSWFVNDVKVLTGNVMTANGVAHVLDGILNPLKKGTNNTTTPTVNPNNTVSVTQTPTETKKSGAIAGGISTTLMIGLSLSALYLLL